MNIYMKNYAIMALFVIFFLGGVVFAGDPPPETDTGTLANSLTQIKDQINAIIPVVALMMIVLAGLIYGIGQVMGAEVRGKSAVWAQALLIGAILGLLIAALADPLVGLFSGAALVTT